MTDYETGYANGESSAWADVTCMVDECGVRYFLAHIGRNDLAKVHLVLDGASQPVAAFSTPERAESYISAQPDIVGSLGPYRPDLAVDEMGLDELPAPTIEGVVDAVHRDKALSYTRIMLARETLTAAFREREFPGVIDQDDPFGVFIEAKRNLGGLVSWLHGEEAFERMLEQDEL